jgi:hypothetical protein
MSSNNSPSASIASHLDDGHDSWGWFVALGIALIILGVVCIAAEVTATLVTVLTFGWLLILGAVLALIQAFRERVLPLFPERAAAGSHRVPANPLSVHRGSESDADSRVIFHRWGHLSGGWGRHAAVSALALGGSFRTRLRGARRHAALAAARSESVVHRTRHRD